MNNDILSEAGYYLDGYSSFDAGYVVKSKWGNCRMASFVQDVDAEDYVEYANRMLKKYGTDTSKWKGGKSHEDNPSCNFSSSPAPEQK